VGRVAGGTATRTGLRTGEWTSGRTFARESQGRHTMRRVAVIVISLVILGVGGCAGGVGPPTLTPTVDITGKWVGSWVATNQALGSGSMEMTVTQTGSKYSGDLLMTGTVTDPSGFTQGVVSGNEVRIEQPPNLTGSLTVQGDTMSGELHGVVDFTATLRRQK